MKNGNIREVIVGFKKIIGDTPLRYNKEAFCQTMNEMLPLKYFALYKYECGFEITIFDSSRERDSWIDLMQQSGLDSDEDCHEVSFDKFVELSRGEWNDPSCYYDEPCDLIVFRL